MKTESDVTTAVLDAVGAFVVVLDGEARVQRLNAAFEALGIIGAHVMGCSIIDDDIVPPEHRELVGRAFDAIVSGELGTIEVDMPTPAGRRRVVWNSAVDRDAAGRVRAVVATGVDITELRSLEARLARSDRLDSISRLAAGVAHDFGNTLAVIDMRLERLREASDPRIVADVAAIERSIAHAAELIGDLTSFSRPTGRSVAAVHLDDELRGMLATIVDTVPRSVVVTLDLGAADACVAMEGAQLHRVIVNLCSNAGDAMRDGGRLTIRTSCVEMDLRKRPSELTVEQLPDGRYTEVVVADNGIGVDRAHLSKIFEPYFTTKPAGRGTGLGLATVYGAVVQCGGAIHVDSAPGQGATFSFWLPLEGQ